MPGAHRLTWKRGYKKKSGRTSGLVEEEIQLATYLRSRKTYVGLANSYHLFYCFDAAFLLLYNRT